jgi:CBS-domain-containing membrane protein
MSGSATQRTPTRLVADIMTINVHAISPEMTVHEAIGLVLQFAVSGAPVVNADNKVITVVSEGDLLKLSSRFGMKRKIADCTTSLVRTEALQTVRKTDTYTHVYMKFLTHPVHRLIVVDDRGQLIGIVSRSNVLQAMYDDA